MLKTMIALTSLICLNGCATDIDGPAVTRDYTGSLHGCAGLTGVSAIYSATAPGFPVRCGPQSVLPVTYR
ncbi:MAG: hypothetical protein AAFP98_09615 [Pseudomonadota bacterium]